jgi:putative transposase
MPSHVHLQVKPKRATEFSLFMKRINLAYFYHFKQSYGWVGHFWQDRFRSQPIGKDQYFIQCGKYIELNPARAKLVKKPEDYPHSSYNYYAKGQPNALITKDIYYNDLGKDVATRQKTFQDMIISETVTNNYQHRVWGSNLQRKNELKKIRNHERITPQQV